MKNSYSLRQIKLIKQWNQLVNTLVPQVNPPWAKPLIVYLAKILPDHCTFNKSIWIKGVLVVYIPTLCSLNPLFEAILEEKHA